jgi:Icc-related predicted phosphoesterase
MKCLVVADLHYALPQFDWVAEVAGRFDFVIIAGDFLDVSSIVDSRVQAIVVRKYVALLQSRTRLISCSGNHDLDSRDASGEKISKWIADLGTQGVLSDWQSFVVEDTLFTVCPWWDGPEGRERLGALLAADARRRSERRWIWVHHAPPDNSPTSWTGSRSFGDTALSKWIDQYSPDMVLSGHVHQSPFAKDGSWVDRIGRTWVFNAGHQYGKPPAYIAFDTEVKQAVWISAAGIQCVDLTNSLTRPVQSLRALPPWLTSADRVGDLTPA